MRQRDGEKERAEGAQKREPFNAKDAEDAEGTRWRMSRLDAVASSA
jgi:hypothetical protein